MNSFWINACLQVARTYVHRARFWITGSVYLLLTLSRESGEAPQVFTSTAIGCVLAGFVALHLRRQFGSPAAKVVPHYALVHFVVGAVVSLAIWCAVPALQAWRIGLPVWGPVGAGGVAGVFLAAVVCWRQALIALAAVPVLLVGAHSLFMFQASSAGFRFLEGELPWASALVILAALAAHVVAAVFLLRLDDRQIAVSDDFVIEMPATDSAQGRWNHWWMKLRDVAVDHALAESGRRGWVVNRWRVPSAVSTAHWGAAALTGASLAAASWLGTGGAEGALIGAEIAAFGMLFIPINAWHLRRGMLPLEFTRPVTRDGFFVQIALAMAFDMAVWTAAASVFSVAVVLLVFRKEPSLLTYPAIQLAFLWSIAVLMYGIGLATFRMRYWLPLMIGSGVMWGLVTGTLCGMVIAGMRPALPDGFPAIFFLSSAVLTSAVLALFTLNRWRTSDVG